MGRRRRGFGGFIDGEGRDGRMEGGFEEVCVRWLIGRWTVGV